MAASYTQSLRADGHFLNLAAAEEHADQAAAYRAYAHNSLATLLPPEFLADQTPGWEGLLKHGMYHERKGLGVDESGMWGDYFLMEALYRVAHE